MHLRPNWKRLDTDLMMSNENFSNVSLIMLIELLIYRLKLKTVKYYNAHKVVDTRSLPTTGCLFFSPLPAWERGRG